MGFLFSFVRLLWLGLFLKLTIPRSLVTKLAENKALTREKVRKRLDLGMMRPDFMDAMIRKSEKVLTFNELVSNAFVLISGGSKTTATTLSAVTFFLATHLAALTKLTEEILSAFQSETQINFLSVQKLSYMSAVLNKSMRLYPPAPGPQPRQIQEGGDEILGEFIPGGTTVDLWQWSVYHNPDHFAKAEDLLLLLLYLTPGNPIRAKGAWGN
ncbi:cytochrome P450, partial [Colletotrichum sublineola]